jgi:hypothetical protein
MTSGWRWIALPGFLAAILGCGSGGAVPVSGTVTFNGSPVEDGEILLLDPELKNGPDAGKIIKGKFSFKARAGKKRVEIRASREVPSKASTMGKVYEDYIPPEFNAQSTLTTEVRPGETNHWEFKLELARK